MSLELQVVSGARAGVRERFEKSIIALGRHPMSDLQLDANKDLDVSTKHAEIRGIDGQYTIHDLGSTNGTYLNGRRIEGEMPVRDGDRIQLGAHGPELVVRVTGEDASRVSGGAAAGVAGAGAPPRIKDASTSPADRHPSPAQAIHPTPQRRPTVERIAEAVDEQTRSMKRMFVGAIAAVVVLVGGAFAYLQYQNSKKMDELVKENVQLQGEMTSRAASLGDSTLVASMRAVRDTIAQLEEQLREGSQAQRAAARTRITELNNTGTAVAQLDLAGISKRNDGAVAFLVSEIDGRPFGGTAFGIRADGLLATNRHNVRSEAGSEATRIAIKFANTSQYLPAHVVKVSDVKEQDLALVQIDVPGTYPVVAGLRASVADLGPGVPVVSIGFPHSLDLPQDGDAVKTTMSTGIVSKMVPSVLQMDSYAGHGSSGSPVFDRSGYVVGVVWGGAAESNGRIVFAVPSDLLAAFLPNDARGVVH